MAARRLVAVLVVLLAISIVAAAIAPERQSGLLGDESTSTTTTTTAPQADPTPSGKLIETTISAAAKDPEVVRARAGDQLEITVTSDAWVEIEIPDFGLLEAASPDAPAVFNLLLRRPGGLPIVKGEGGAEVGRIVVAARGEP
jgi:hypothetical protein